MVQVRLVLECLKAGSSCVHGKGKAKMLACKDDITPALLHPPALQPGPSLPSFPEAHVVLYVSGARQLLIKPDA